MEQTFNDLKQKQEKICFKYNIIVIVKNYGTGVKSLFFFIAKREVAVYVK